MTFTCKPALLALALTNRARKLSSPRHSPRALFVRPEVPVDLDARIPAVFAAERLRVSKQLFNYWRRSGHISPGDDGLYRLGDVLEVERRMRRHPNSRRQIQAA